MIATSRTCAISGQTTKGGRATSVRQEGGQRRMRQAVIGGWCDPRLDAVRTEFERNFRERGETGAAVCVTIDGAVVADLWGGWTDAQQRRPWAPDTLVNVFSVGKGAAGGVPGPARRASACLTRTPGDAVLAGVRRSGKERGYRSPAAQPSGRACRRCAQRCRPGSGLDWQLMTSLLAAEEPWWPPGAGHGYHVNTFGLPGRRADAADYRDERGRVPAARVAGPLGADVHIGLPAAEHGRVAEFQLAAARPAAARGPEGDRALGQRWWRAPTSIRPTSPAPVW